MTERSKELRKETQLRAQILKHHVVKALEAKGHRVVTGDSDWEGRINTIDEAWVDFTIKCQWSWGSHVTGKLTYSFGTYGKRKSFPEPKKGYDIARIVAQLEQATEARLEVDRMYSERAKIERQAKEEFQVIEPKLRALGFCGQVNQMGKPTITKSFESVRELDSFLQTIALKGLLTKKGETK